MTNFQIVREKQSLPKLRNCSEKCWKKFCRIIKESKLWDNLNFLQENSKNFGMQQGNPFFTARSQNKKKNISLFEVGFV